MSKSSPKRNKELRELTLQKVASRYADLSREELLRKLATLTLTARGYFRKIRKLRAGTRGKRK